MTKRRFIKVAGWMTLIAGLTGGLFVGDTIRKAAFNEFLKTDFEFGADDRLNQEKLIALLTTAERWLDAIAIPMPRLFANTKTSSLKRGN